jgi:hypothetical protein
MTTDDRPGTPTPEPFAEVVLSMGRHHLKVGGFILGTEGDKCRDGSLPESVLPPIPPEELEEASIGGKPAKDMPIEIVRFFRGDYWTPAMMEYVAGRINELVIVKGS